MKEWTFVPQELKYHPTCLIGLYNAERAYLTSTEDEYKPGKSLREEVYPLIFSELLAYITETWRSDGPTGLVHLTSIQPDWKNRSWQKCLKLRLSRRGEMWLLPSAKMYGRPCHKPVTSHHADQSTQGLAKAHAWPQIYIWWNIPRRMYSRWHTTNSSSVCGHDWTWGRHKIPTEVGCIKVRPGNGAAAIVQLLCKIQRRSSYPPTFKRTGDTIPSLHGHVCLYQNQKETAGRNVTRPWH